MLKKITRYLSFLMVFALLFSCLSSNVFAVDLDYIDDSGLTVRPLSKYISSSGSTLATLDYGSKDYSKGLTSLEYKLHTFSNLKNTARFDKIFEIKATDSLLFKKDTAYSVTLDNLFLGCGVVHGGGSEFFNIEISSSHLLTVILYFSDGTSKSLSNIDYKFSPSSNVSSIKPGVTLGADTVAGSPLYCLSFDIPAQDKIVTYMTVTFKTDISSYYNLSLQNPSSYLSNISAGQGFDYMGFENFNIDISKKTDVVGQLDNTNKGITSIISILTNLFNSFVSGISDLLSSGDDLFYQVYDVYVKISSLPSDIWNKMSGSFTSLINGNTSIFNEVGNVFSAVNELPGEIWSEMSAAFTSLQNGINNLSSGIWNKMSSSFSSLVTTSTNIFNSVTDLPSDIWYSFNVGLQTLFIPKNDCISENVKELRSSFPLIDNLVDFANTLVDKFDYYGVNYEPVLTVDIPKNESSFYLRGEHLRYWICRGIPNINLV